MLFNSYIFIFAFVPIVFAGYFYLNKLKLLTGSKLWLIASSLFFYAYWTLEYLPLILGSITINFFVSRLVSNQEKSVKHRKIWLISGIVLNILLLCFYKYMDFFITNINFITDANIHLLQIALPLAISFFTLQQVAFLIDSYEGLTNERKFIDYTLFVVFFPQLIAGPIVHHKEMIPQFQKLRNKFIHYENIKLGLFIFSIGLFKKVILADNLAIYANPGFTSPDALTLFSAWQTSLSYSFQLYFDFSGYADMAIGVALLFNIKLPINFNSPFQSTNIIDFWSKWHITLTKFITSYIYIPIVRSFSSFSFHKAMLATFASIFIAGVWHGAGWTFVTYGALHGVALIVNHYWRKTKIQLNKYVAWLLFFMFINIAFIIFRSNTLEDAFSIIFALINFTNIGSVNLAAFALITASLLITTLLKNTSSYLNDNIKTSRISLLFSIIIFFLSIILLSQPTEFIYFQF